MKIKTAKAIQMIDLVKFCEQYNSTGYGTAEITELKSKIIVKLYNAGWSDNESMDIGFNRQFHNSIIYNRHPITIAEFSKLNMVYNNFVVGFENPDGWGEFYSKKKKFTYKIEID